MTESYKKSTGYALIISSILLVVTMGLHPAGGNFQHLLKIIPINITAHSLAIISIPISLFGFWGLKKSLDDSHHLSTFSFIIAAIAHLAGLIAGALNGLTLSFFVNHYRDASAETIDAIKPIIRYNGCLNLAFDYIFIVGICISIILWSVLILKSRVLPKWLAYWGLLLTIGYSIAQMTGYTFVNLFGFRIFIFGLVSWIVVAGYRLLKLKE